VDIASFEEKHPARMTPATSAAKVVAPRVRRVIDEA
jgi:hypothetical protein